jgi:chromosome partitioning protein
MITILVANQKGGSGKTTLAAHLAVGLCKRHTANLAKLRADAGGPELGAVLVDTDPQGSLSSWWEAREDAIPNLLVSDLDALPDRLGELANKGVRATVIDSFPASMPDGIDVVQRLIGHADLVLVPVRPSVLDLQAASRTIWMTQEAGVDTAFVISQGIQGSNAMRDVWIVLEREFPRAQFPRLHTCPYPLASRVAFADAMAGGGTVLDAGGPGGPARNEVNRLIDWIFEVYIKPHFAEQQGAKTG